MGFLSQADKQQLKRCDPRCPAESARTNVMPLPASPKTEAGIVVGNGIQSETGRYLGTLTHDEFLKNHSPRGNKSHNQTPLTSI